MWGSGRQVLQLCGLEGEGVQGWLAGFKLLQLMASWACCGVPPCFPCPTGSLQLSTAGRGSACPCCPSLHSLPASHTLSPSYPSLSSRAAYQDRGKAVAVLKAEVWGAACGQAAADRAEGKEDSDAEQGLSKTERELVGRQCKRLLDMGRVRTTVAHGP